MSTYITKHLNIVLKDLVDSTIPIEYIPNGVTFLNRIRKQCNNKDYDMYNITSKYINDGDTYTFLVVNKKKQTAQIVSTGNIYYSLANSSFMNNLLSIDEQYEEESKHIDGIILTPEKISIEESDKLFEFKSNISKNKIVKLQALCNTSVTEKDKSLLVRVKTDKITKIMSDKQLVLPLYTGTAFNAVKIDTLDFSELNTENVKVTTGMFIAARINKLSFKHFKGKIVSAYMMFEGLRVNELDISDLDTSQIFDADWMFSNIVYRNGNISVQLPKARTIEYAFNHAQLNRLEISNLHDVCTAESMFRQANIKEVIFKDCNFDEETNISYLFCKACIEKLRFINCNFKISQEDKSKSMFIGGGK